MAVNPFFLHGSSTEQRLVQSLINEQLRLYGVEVIYIPRKFVNRDSILREITASKFDDNFALEAYVNTYDGYSGAGDLMTKFGVSLKDELIVTISKERFEDFISPFLENENDEEIVLSSRPREGDLIYFPLGQRIFEIKFVEHEKPFYQLGKTYVYELKCELFEYEDEMGGWDNINTTTEEIDSTLVNQGYITSLQLFSFGKQALGTAPPSFGYVRRVILTNDGSGYTQVPTVAISTAPEYGVNATAVAITTSINGIYSVKEILLTNTGSGYTTTPTVSIIGGNGVGAAATCEIVSLYSGFTGINSVFIYESGDGYPAPPLVTFSSPPNLSDSGISGICTPLSKLSGTSSFQPVSNKSVRIITSSSSGTISTITNNLIGPASLTESTVTDYSNPFFNSDDDGFWELNLPFSISYIGSTYNKLYVSTNNYVLFGSKPSDDYDSTIAWNYNTSTPNIPKIQISTKDGSAQRIFYGVEGTSPNRTYRIRFEGHEVFFNGILGFPTITWEMIFYENQTNKIDLHVGKNPRIVSGVTAKGVSTLNADGSVSRILISDAGIGYTYFPTVTIAPPPIITGIGTFEFNEIVTGSVSGATARVKSWDKNDNILKVGTTNGEFVPNDVIVGSSSSARYSLSYLIDSKFSDKYEQNDVIEEEADLILDFTESNPFGNY